jgi:hypothetical protein
MSDSRHFASVFSVSGGNTGGLCSWQPQFSGVKPLGPTFGGCTLQWWLPIRFLVESTVWKLDLLQGEKPGSNHVG